ncbi:unnamed protein product, partial [Symbiodinium microadriaticum]
YNQAANTKRNGISTLWAKLRRGWGRIPQAYTLPESKKSYTKGRPIVAFVNTMGRPLWEALAGVLQLMTNQACPHAFRQGDAITSASLENAYASPTDSDWIKPTNSNSMMKRMAAEAGLPEPFQQLTYLRSMCRRAFAQALTFYISCQTSGTVDDIKRVLQHRIYDAAGRSPKLSSFQLRKGGKHVAYTERITAFSMLLPVIFMRTTPDEWY